MIDVDPALVIQPGDRVLERVQIDNNLELRDRCDIEGWALVGADVTLCPPRRWELAWVETAEGKRALRFAPDDGDNRELYPRRHLQSYLGGALIDAMEIIGTLDSRITISAARAIAEGVVTERTPDGEMGRYWVPVCDWEALEREVGAFDLLRLSLEREYQVASFGAGERGRRWRRWWTFDLEDQEGKAHTGHLIPTWQEDGASSEARAWREGSGCASGGLAQIALTVDGRHLRLAPPANIPPTEPKVDAP